jgi:hypothetical protein
MAVLDQGMDVTGQEIAEVSKPCVVRWQERFKREGSLACCATRRESPACHRCRQRWSTASSN